MLSQPRKQGGILNSRRVKELITERRCQDLQGRCVAVIPVEMERDQTRYSLEYMSSYAEAGIQLIEVEEDMVEIVSKTIKVEYPLDLSLVPVGGDIADFAAIVMGMGCSQSSSGARRGFCYELCSEPRPQTN